MWIQSANAPLDSLKKQQIWQHMVGNYLSSATPNNIRQRSKRLVETLTTTSIGSTEKKGMYKFIDTQEGRYPKTELESFKSECMQTIENFNKEFEDLLITVNKDSLDEYTIRNKVNALADKRKEEKFM